MSLHPSLTRAAVVRASFFAFCLLLPALLHGPVLGAQKFPTVGKPAPDFVLTNSWGHKDYLKQFLGKKVIIMNFGSHKSEKEATGLFVTMARMYYTHPGVKIYSMIVLKDLPFYANKQTVIDRVKEIGRNISYPELGGTMDWEGKVSSKYGVNMGPNLLVINKKGKIVFMQGDLYKGSTRELHTAVETALKEK